MKDEEITVTIEGLEESGATLLSKRLRAKENTRRSRHPAEANRERERRTLPLKDRPYSGQGL